VPSTYPATPGESTQTGQPQGWGQQGTTQWGQPTWAGPYGGAGQPGAPPPPGLPPGQPPGWGPGGWQQARPKPGIIPLRPISLLEIYDGAFQALRTNPRTMIGVSAVVIAITTLISAVPQAFGLVAFSRALLRDPGAAGASPQEIATGVTGLASGFIIPAVIEWLAVTVVTGLLIVAVSAAVLGRRTPPGVLWQRTRGRVAALIGVAVLVPLAILAVVIAFTLPGTLLLIAGATPAGVVLLVLGVLATVPVAILLGVRWSMAPPALLLEELPVVASIGRSWRLVRGSFWRVFGILVLTGILVSIASSVITFPLVAISALLDVGNEVPYSNFAITLAQLAIRGVATIVSGAIFYPFQASVTALLYIDLRMRREGLDVELIRASEGGIGG
jgi:hypothetical protein